MKNVSIGAFYQCYKQPKALLEVIRSFRKYYPESDVYLVCDGGNDYSGVAKKFNLKYRYDEKRTGNGVANYFDNPEILYIWLDRLIDAAKNIKEDYIMILEDDVIIYDAVTELHFDLNGVNKGEKIGKKVTKFLKTRNSHIPKRMKNYFYGGFGGAILNKKILLDNQNSIKDAIATIDKYMEAPRKGIYVTDLWISLLYLYFGASAGHYRGLVEKWYKTYFFRKYILKNIKTLHQYKNFYNKELTREDVDDLGWESL